MGNTPNIRFKGFTDDWEQRKLGELVEFYNGDRSSRYPNDSDMVSEGVPFINAGDLVSGRVKLDTANKITEEKFNELSGAKIQRGDIIYCLRGTLGKNAFVDNFDVGTVASSLVDIRPKKVVGKYLYQVLNSDIEYTQRIVNDEGAAQPNLSAKNLSLFNIPMPDEVEQEKIAAYFDDLDNLITLHQRKCDETKELKKFMLQKMFPKNGEKKPEIRFEGFTDDWEQRKLGELVEFYNGDRSSRYPNDSDMVSEGVPFINAGDLVSGRVKLDTANKITEEKFNELSGAKIQRGDIIYCLRGTLGKNAFVDNFDVGTVASSLVDIRPKKVVGKYLYQVLNSDIEYTQRIVNDEGAAQPNLSAKNLSLFNIPMPDEVEQEKIAAYFDDLDNLITLHQRKCDEIKEIKKFMLQNMFPQKG